jgi:hypothetical protein
MKERSGMDMIADLLREVKLMRKEIKVLDQNIKKVANSAKISEIATKALQTPLKDWAKQSAPKVEAVNPKELVKKENLRFKFETVDASKTNQPKPSRAKKTVELGCLCQGKMIADYGGKAVPLPGLDVKIYNEKDSLVKETKTNKAGYWLSKLFPGNYVANIEGTFNGKALYPVNINFTVKPGMDKLEVK